MFLYNKLPQEIINEREEVTQKPSLCKNNYLFIGKEDCLGKTGSLERNYF
jgi:hypothetical protein